MSIRQSKNEISRFLASEDAEVLCIHGEWGVGKTYTWKQYLHEIAHTGVVPLKKYSYVSVYGLADNKELKSAVYRNQISVLNVATLPDEKTLAQSISELYSNAKPFFRHIGGFLGAKGRAISSFAEDLAFQSVRRQIVCFDDLERSGKNLSMREIMGLASFLKEERDCKVILLLNDQVLDGEPKSDYKLHFEKVVDSAISFVPTPEEIVDIALAKELPFHEFLADTVRSARISNIRTLKKIERLSRQVLSTFEYCGDDDFAKQVVQTISVATLVKLSGRQGVSLEDLRKFNALSQPGENDGEAKRWFTDLLGSVGYTGTDAVDLVLIDGVEHGWVDYELLKQKFAETRAEKKAWSDETPYSESWNLYHNGLDIDDQALVEKMYQAVIDDPNSVSLLNFNSTIRLFRELGFSEKADELMEKYFFVRQFDWNALEEDVFLYADGNVDPKIEEHFANLKAAYVDPRKPEDVLTSMFVQQGYSEADLALLAKLSPDELVTMFENLEFKNVGRGLKWAARFVDTQMHPPLGANLRAAFNILAERSAANKRKLKSLGFDPDD